MYLYTPIIDRLCKDVYSEIFSNFLLGMVSSQLILAFHCYYIFEKLL